VKTEQKWRSNLIVIRHSESARNLAKAAAMRDRLYEFGSRLRDALQTLKFLKP
jgi:hypothetical protein